MFQLKLAPRRRHNSRPGSRGPVRSRWPIFDPLEGRQLLSSDLIVSSSLLSPAPIAARSFTGVVAKFTDADKNTDPSAYAASIRWGDGTSSQGTIAVDPAGGFDVSGTHTYAQGKAFRITAKVGDKDGDSASASTTNVVAPAPISAVGVLTGVTNGGVSNRVVAAFTDADRGLKASAFTAVIDWGDGHTSTGSIIAAKSKNGFKVVGSHKYKTPGTFTIQATIQQGKGALSFDTVSNLMSDGAVSADHVNPNFVNPWGLVAPNPGAFWSANNGTGTSSVFDSKANLSVSLPFVTIPPPAGSTDSSAPTGVVMNSGSGFVVSDGTHSGTAAFIFSTEDGTISGWNPRVDATGTGPSRQAALEVDDSASGAVFKGLALFTIPAGNPLAAGEYLFASDFHNNAIDVFDQNFKPVTLSSGAFQDPSLPAGFAPFGVQALNGELYVTYAKQDDDKHDDVAGPGNGFVDVYSVAGSLVLRLGGPGIQNELNSPWGVTQAPADFGVFSNDLLVGNFGDSHVSVFDPTSGAFLGQLNDAQGHPLVLNGGFQGSDTKGLWGIFAFGHSNPAGPTNAVFFNSGFNDENDGLFGSLTASTNGVTTSSVVSVPGRSRGK